MFGGSHGTGCLKIKQVFASQPLPGKYEPTIAGSGPAHAGGIALGEENACRWRTELLPETSTSIIQAIRRMA